MNLVPHEVTPAPPPSTLMVRRSGIGMRWSFGRDLGTIGLVLGAPRATGQRHWSCTEDAPDCQLCAARADAERDGGRARALPELGFVASGLVRQHQAHLAAGVRSYRPCLLSRCAVPCSRIMRRSSRWMPLLLARTLGADREFLETCEAWIIDRAARPVGFADSACLRSRHDDRADCCTGEQHPLPSVATMRAAPPGLPAHQRSGLCRTSRAMARGSKLPAVDTVTTMVRGNWPTRQKLLRFGLALQAVG